MGGPRLDETTFQNIRLDTEIRKSNLEFRGTIRGLIDVINSHLATGNLEAARKAYTTNKKFLDQVNDTTDTNARAAGMLELRNQVVKIRKELGFR